jgi:hypothetical protein
MSLEQIAHDCTVRIRLDGTAFRSAARPRRWTAEAGRWSAAGASEKAAVDTLAGRVREFLTHYRAPAIESFRGYTAVLSLDLGDEYNTMALTEQVVGPDGRVSYSGVGADSWQEAQARTRYHLAQRTTDFHDDSSVHEAAAYLSATPHPTGRSGADELYRYASWQRAARAAIDAGRDDWHEWASEHCAEFPIARPVPTGE